MAVVRHVGLVVENIERSLEFYENVFGFSIQGRRVETGEYIANLTGIDGAVLEWVKLSAGSCILELIEYKSEKSEKPTVPFKANAFGCSHIAVTVDDIDKIYHELSMRGLPCESAPLLSPDKKVKVLYAHDPDGIIIEIVEDL